MRFGQHQAALAQTDKLPAGATATELVTRALRGAHSHSRETARPRRDSYRHHRPTPTPSTVLEAGLLRR